MVDTSGFSYTNTKISMDEKGIFGSVSAGGLSPFRPYTP